MGQPFDPEAVLNQPLMANLASVSADGAPRNAPMWFIWEEDAIWLLGATGASSVRRLHANPQCAIEIVDFDNAAGKLLHLGLRGKAEVVENDPARFRRLLMKYLGPEADWNGWFIENVACIEAPESCFIRMAPESVFTNNVSYFRSGPELSWP